MSRLIVLAGALAVSWLTPMFGSDAPSVDHVSGAVFARVPAAGTGGAVLDIAPGDEWRSQAVGAPSVLLERSRYFMWFTGIQVVQPGESPYLFRSAIGLASSRDGLTWELMNDGRPVLGPGERGAFDALATGQGSVLRDGGRYLMWYGGADGTQAADSVRIERIGLAESRDGIRWTRLNGGRPVVDIGPPGSLDSTQATGPFVLRVDDEFLMWYGAFNGRHSIAAARSADGITWEKRQVTGLGDGEMLGPAVYAHDDEFFMLYSTVIDGRWTMVSARSADGFTWQPLNGRRPVLGPPASGAFDDADRGQNHSVHPSEIVWDGRRLRVWYMAESRVEPWPQRIGLMEALVPRDSGH